MTDPQKQCDEFFDALDPAEFRRMLSFFTNFVGQATEQPATAEFKPEDGHSASGAAFIQGRDLGDENPLSGSRPYGGRGFLW